VGGGASRILWPLRKLCRDHSVPWSRMPRRLRYVPPGGALVEITCRTVQGRLLLRPSPILRDTTLGVLARAARRSAVEVHAYAFLSNHYHLLVSVHDARQLSAFMTYLNSNLAREAGRLVRWREKFWGRRYQAIPVSAEAEAQVERLSYILAHGVKEGLVASPFDWPGAHCARALVDGAVVSGHWHDRTLEHQARRKSLPLDPNTFVEREELTLAPLPCWRSLEPLSYRDRVRRLVEAIEEVARRKRETTGKSPLGRDGVCRQNPHLEPNRLKKGPAPLVHAADPRMRRALRRAYFRFLDAYRSSALRLRSGALDVEFPVGSFPPALPFRVATRAG
jgi:REP element-mobilizing transposase RayT